MQCLINSCFTKIFWGEIQCSPVSWYISYRGLCIVTLLVIHSTNNYNTNNYGLGLISSFSKMVNHQAFKLVKTSRSPYSFSFVDSSRFLIKRSGRGWHWLPCAQRTDIQHYGRLEFESQLNDLSRSRPPLSVSYLTCCHFYTALYK